MSFFAACLVALLYLLVCIGFALAVCPRLFRHLPKDDE